MKHIEQNLTATIR